MISNDKPTIRLEILASVMSEADVQLTHDTNDSIAK